MYELKITNHFSKAPTFSLADVSQIIPNRDYAKKVLSKMVRRNMVWRVRRDAYTFFDDPFLIAPFLVKPSYISSVSALSYHHKITQVPGEVYCVTTKPTKRFFFKEWIHFHHTKFFFGFASDTYDGFEIPIATPEKAIIDSIGNVPLSVVEEAFDDVDEKRMIAYLERINKSSLAKRIGYMLEKHGCDVHPLLKDRLNRKYIPLDPLSSSKTKKNRTWRLRV